MHLKQYEIVMDVDKLKVDLRSTFEKYKTIKQWAYIIHDKDDTRPHYHIYISFGTASVDSKKVAEWFQLGWMDENGVEHSGENFIEKVKGRKVDMLLYLTHENVGQEDKHIYPRSEIVANFSVDDEIEIENVLGNFDAFSYAQMINHIKDLPVEDRVKKFTKLKKLWELRCQAVTLNPDRQLDVVFICGKGGTGKTYYAKKMLESMGLDFCVSSSSNDPFQDYLGQNAIILDDLRYRTFELEDLLKILDNNTASSVKSRFTNKAFNGKVIVITSSVPLWYWYPDHRNDIDSLVQLYRRIGTYIEVTDTQIKVYRDGVGEDGRPAGLPDFFENDVQKKFKGKNKKTDFGTVFNKFTNAIFLQPSPIDSDDLPF